jgi:pimeloyl-ACP methyl ester carboxylesterase
MHPIILVPGLNVTERLYAAQVRGLAGEANILLANHRAAATMADIADGILAGAPPRFSLVGLSMGGYVALEIMRRAPERVGRLVLMDTSARPDMPEQTANRRRQMEIARAGRFPDIAGMQFPMLVHESRAVDEALFGIVKGMAADTGAEAFIRQQEAIIGRADSRPSLGAIRCPTLVVVGEGDRLTPPELAREIAGGIAGAELAVVAGAGHLTPLEAPEAVTALLRRFLG